LKNALEEPQCSFAKLELRPNEYTMRLTNRRITAKKETIFFVNRFAPLIIIPA